MATLTAGPGVAEWSVWSTTARLVVTDPEAVHAARRLVQQHLAEVDRAASRFRRDSEVNRLHLAGGRPQQVSPLLAELLEVALLAARRTDGDVDPTLGAAMSRLGYDRDLSLLPTCGSAVRVVTRAAPGWQRLRLDGTTLTVPPGVAIDLGATAKAAAADHCAAAVHERLGTGVLVSLGGDVATAGPAPAGGWQVLVQDRPGDPATQVTLPAGAAIATSSTVSRQWVREGRVLHHVLDPRTCRPAERVWRSVTVVAPTCVEANTLTTASLVRGHAAVGWLRGLSVAARLVTADGRVVTTTGWGAQERAA